ACGVSLLPHRKWTRRLLWRKFPATGIRRSESALALPKLKSPVPFETGPSLDGSGSETRLLLRGFILRPLSGKNNPLLVCAAGQSARTARKVELSIRTCQINDRDTL